MSQADCPFCKIARGEISPAKVLEDDVCVAFLDIGPLSEGHLLLIPKAHAEQIDDLPADQAGAMLAHLPALTRALRQVTGCEGVNILQNNGRVAHQAVMHVHFHLIPRRAGDEFHFNWPARNYPPGRAAELADKIRQAMGGCLP